MSSSGSSQPTKFYPPWTFKESADEATAKLSKLAEDSPDLKLMEQNGNYWWLVYTGGVFGGTTDLEFIIRESDKIVTVRAASRRSARFYAFSEIGRAHV